MCYAKPNSESYEICSGHIVFSINLIKKGGLLMVAVISRDYRFLMGKISMDLSFAEKFFSAADAVMANYSLTSEERENLKNLSFERFQEYKKSIILKTCDCDSCCNGGEGKGNCCECFVSCCQ